MMNRKSLPALLTLPLLTVAVSLSETGRPAKSAGLKTPAVSPDANRPSKSALPRPNPDSEQDKLILVLHTRHHRITVYGGDRSPKYTVHTEGGDLLAKEIDKAVLKEKFPALHEVVTGRAWAGTLPPRVFRGD